MQMDFNMKNILHRIAVKFVRACLPDAKKPYYLKAVHQPELDIHGIASKAALYNISTSPKVIEEGLSAGFELIRYLAADGYKMKTPLFNLKIRIPGEYYGAETALTEGLYPCVRLQTSDGFRKYLKENVKLVFDGFDDCEGFIAEALDEATGLVSKKMTRGNILTIHGYGLKIDSDKEHEKEAGVFFTTAAGSSVKVSMIPVNEPQKLKVIVPSEIESDTPYIITIGTMSSVKSKGILLKRLRSVSSGFALTA